MHFRDRRDAGQQLARLLAAWRGAPGLIVLALPRGGVPVGFEVARALEAPLDVLVVRKLGYPGHEEYAFGAVASGGIRVMNAAHGAPVPGAAAQAVIRREEAELKRRERLYRGERGAPDVRGRPVILVDDGLATGATMRAAAEAVRTQQPARVCIAVPTGSTEACESLREVADEVVCAFTPEPFRAVGLWYEEFPQCDDREVQQLLRDARAAAEQP